MTVLPIFYDLLTGGGNVRLCFALLILIAVLTALAYFLKWRKYALVAKYVEWQHDGQKVEVATHDALYASRDDKEPPYPSVSIVVPSFNQGELLAYDLPRLLTQQYRGTFEVIVCDEGSDDDTVDIVERLAADHSNLRMTRIPDSARQVSPRKLAITLGIKAAYGEWVIVLRPDTSPETKTWLQHYAENLGTELNFVQAYYNYENDGSIFARRAILVRVMRWIDRLDAFDDCLVTGSDDANYAVRKQWFLSQGGFADSLSLSLGEADVLAACHARAEDSLMLCSPDTKLVEELPSHGELRYRERAERASLRVKPRAVRSRSMRRKLANLLPPLISVFAVAYLVLRLIHDIYLACYPLSRFPLDLLFVALIGCSLYLPVSRLRKSLSALRERRFGAYLWWYELTSPRS